MKKRKFAFSYTNRKFSLPDGAKAYAELKSAITTSGLTSKNYTYYIFLNIFCVFFIVLSIYELIVQKNLWLVALWTIVFSFISVQVGGLMHDAGHRCIFKSTKWNDFFGHIYGAYIAAGYSSWKYRHNRHHAHTNEIEEDHDIFDFKFLSLDPETLKKSKGVSRYLYKFQVFLYYPIFLFFTFGMRSYAVRFYKDKKKKYAIEIAVYILGLFAWYVLPFFVFDIHKAVLFFLLNNMVMGFYFMNIFASNHKPMPLIHKGAKLSFIEQQIVTSCNVHPNWLTDFVLLGLNYQIEHHLFPNTARPNLKKLRPYVMAFCKQRGLGYTSVSVIEVNKMILTRLHEIAGTIEV